MGLGKKLISNTTFLLIDWFFVSAFSLLFWLVIGKFLSKEDYGIITTSINTAILLSTVSLLGFGTTLTKLISEYIQKGKKNLYVTLIKFSFKILIVSNLLIIAVLALFSNDISTFLKIPQTHVILIGIATLLMSLSNVAGYILQGFQEMKVIALSDLFGYFIKASGTLIALLFFPSSIFPVIIFAISYLILSLLRIKFRWFLEKGDGLDYKKIISNYAIPTFIGSIAWMTFTNAQYIILNVIQNPTTTGVFSIAAILTTLIAIIPVTLNGALFPILSQLSVSSTFKRQQKFFLSTVLRYALILALPLTLLFTLFPTKLIILFSKPEFLDAKSLFPILSFAALLNGIGIIFHSSLYALRKVMLNTTLIIFTAIIFFVLAIILTEMFSAMGLAVAYTTAMIFLFSSSLICLRKIVRFSVPRFDIAKIVIATIISISIYAFLLTLSKNNLLQIIFLGVSACFYLISLLFLKFFNKLDLKILEFISGYAPSFLKNLLDVVIKIISKFS